MYRREWGIAESVLLIIIVFLIFSSLFVFSVIKALRSGILPVAVDLVCGKRCSEDVEAPVIEIVKLPWEINTLIDLDVEIWPVFRTVEDIKAYANNRRTLLKLMAEKKEDIVVEAVIQPIRPLTLEEFLQLITKYNVTVYAFGYWSYPDGGAVVVIRSEEDLLGFITGKCSTWYCELIRYSCEFNMYNLINRGVRFRQFICMYRISGISVKAELEELIRVNEDPLVLTVDLLPFLTAGEYYYYIWHYIPEELRDEYTLALSKYS